MIKQLKKYLAGFLVATLIFAPFPVVAFDQFNWAPQNVVYHGTVTGLLVSAVDGTAFIDALSGTLAESVGIALHSDVAVTGANSKISAAAAAAFYDDASGVNLQAHLGKYLVVKDSAGKKIKGWIKAAGTGETYTTLIGGATLNGNMEANAEWTANLTPVVCEQSADFAHTGTYSWKFTPDSAGDGFKSTSAFTLVNGALYKSDMWVYFAAGSRFNYSFFDGTSYYDITDASNPTGSWIQKTKYSTVKNNPTANIVYFGSSSDTSGARYVDDLTLQKVLTPSTSGVSISSTKGGTAMDNWESLESGFNYNDSSGYTYTIYDRDITALADGNHQIEIYDSSNRMIRGVLKAAGSGETVGNELFTDPGFDNAGLWSLSADWSISLGVANASGAGNGYVYQTANLSFSDLSLLFLSVALTTNSSSIRIGSPSYPTTEGGSFTGTGTISRYCNATGPGAWGLRSLTSVILATSISAKQVTAPSTDGATIVTAKAGTTYNFNYKHASFTYNAASYFCVVRKLR